MIGNVYLKTNSQFHLMDFLVGGTLLFFATAVVAAICMDYYLGKDFKLPILLSGFIYFLYPSIVLILSIWVFSTSFNSKSEELNPEFLRTVQQVIISMTLIYALITKSIMYFFESKEA